MQDNSDLVIRVRAEEIHRFVQTGSVEDEQVRRVISESNEIFRVLATLDIIYGLPDYANLVQQFVWQRLDLFPTFPNIRRFLDFWDRTIEGKLHEVAIASTRYYGASNLVHVNAVYTLQ